MWPWNYKREIARLRSAVQKAENERDIAVGEHNDVLNTKRKALEDLRAMKKDRNEWRDSAMALKEELGEKKDEIACVGDYHVLAVVACPCGSAVRWFSIHRMSHEVFAHGGVSQFTLGARNNIVLTGGDGAATFYEMRAGFRYDTVKKYRVDPTNLPRLRIGAVTRAKNGLCGVRWGLP